MSTYETNISMMEGLQESDLLIIKEFIIRLTARKEIKEESFNPYQPLTREEISERLKTARKHAEEGMLMDAHQASANIREKYGL